MCSPPDSANLLVYDPFINRFKDECGDIVHDLHQYFDTWQLDQWKKTANYALMLDKNGDLWELIYDDSMCEFCDHLCLTCPSKCEIYNFVRD